MAGGSEEALVDRRNPSGDHLGLRARDALMLLKIRHHHLAHRHVLDFFQLQVVAQLARNQTERSHDVGAPLASIEDFRIAPACRRVGHGRHEGMFADGRLGALAAPLAPDGS